MKSQLYMIIAALMIEQAMPVCAQQILNRKQIKQPKASPMSSTRHFTKRMQQAPLLFSPRTQFV